MGQRRRFKHAPTVTSARGRIRIQCQCGWQGAKRPSEELVDAQAEYTAHVGLREQQERHQSGDGGVLRDVPPDQMEALLASVFWPQAYH